MMTEENAFGTPVAHSIVEIPIEAIVNGEVVEVATKAIPIIPIRTNSIE